MLKCIISMFCIYSMTVPKAGDTEFCSNNTLSVWFSLVSLCPTSELTLATPQVFPYRCVCMCVCGRTCVCTRASLSVGSVVWNPLQCEGLCAYVAWPC